MAGRLINSSHSFFFQAKRQNHENQSGPGSVWNGSGGPVFGSLLQEFLCFSTF